MRRYCIVFAALAIGACAQSDSGDWTRPGTSSAHAGQDRASCRGEANRRAEQDYALETSRFSNSGYATGNTVQNNLAKIDAQRFRRSLYENCLRNLGYQKSDSK